MSEERKRSWIDQGLSIALCAGVGLAIGAIIVLPFKVADLTDKVQQLNDTYIAVEMCKNDADLDVCGLLEGQDHE